MMIKPGLLGSLTGVAMILLLAGCSQLTPPQGVHPVKPFDLNQYQGKWYEIARLDNAFEKDLQQVTATYQPQKNGTVKVINRGFNPIKKQWQQSTGLAKFTGSVDTAALKVSFFGPFYASYNVIYLDNKYQYALVCGPNKDYLWLLSRTPTLTKAQTNELLAQARRYGFSTSALVWTAQ